MARHHGTFPYTLTSFAVTAITCDHTVVSWHVTTLLIFYNVALKLTTILRFSDNLSSDILFSTAILVIFFKHDPFAFCATKDIKPKEASQSQSNYQAVSKIQWLLCNCYFLCVHWAFLIHNVLFWIFVVYFSNVRDSTLIIHTIIHNIYK